MNATAPKDQHPQSFLSPGIQRKLHYWFVQYNPLYFFSALCVLSGMFLVSKGLADLEWRMGHALTAAIMQSYEILLVLGAMFLFRFADQRRPAVILAIMEIFFLYDSTFQTEMLTELEGIGMILSAGWVLFTAAKLVGLAWIFSLRMHFTAMLLPILGALGIVLFPNAMQNMPARQIELHIAATWYGVVLAALALGLCPRVECRLDLGEWGQTVLRRISRTVLIMWSGFYALHLFTWVQLFNISFTLAQAAPFFLFWFLAKKERWPWAGSVIIVVLASVVPASVFPAALIVSAAFGIKARHLGIRRMYVGSVLYLYFALTMIGWQGVRFPEPNLWVTLLSIVCLLVMAWRMRLWSALIAAVLVIAPVARFPIPQTPLQWGILVLSVGFLALVGGVIVSVRFGKLKPPEEEPGELEKKRKPSDQPSRDRIDPLPEKTEEQKTEVKEPEPTQTMDEEKKPLSVLDDSAAMPSPEPFPDQEVDPIYKRKLTAKETAVIDCWLGGMGANDKFHTYPSIPEKKLHNALDLFASPQSSELIVGLLDTTLWGSGKVGCLITTQGIYYRSDDTDNPTGYAAFASIDPEAIKESRAFSKQVVTLGPRWHIVQATLAKQDFDDFVGCIRASVKVCRSQCAEE